MARIDVKYCRNCENCVRGWCEWYQQPEKPVAGRCPAFITKHRKPVKPRTEK